MYLMDVHKVGLNWAWDHFRNIQQSYVMQHYYCCFGVLCYIM